ncbi:MAG: hypothetical protein QXI39_08325 [Candidatus Bathyarchaeia archaeon]
MGIENEVCAMIYSRSDFAMSLKDLRSPYVSAAQNPCNSLYRIEEKGRSLSRRLQNPERLHGLGIPKGCEEGEGEAPSFVSFEK